MRKSRAKRGSKLRWRSKRANHGHKPASGRRK